MILISEYITKPTVVHINDDEYSSLVVLFFFLPFLLYFFVVLPDSDPASHVKVSTN